MRPRLEPHPVIFALVRPAFRYSRSRDAYILRAVGGSRGPVLRRRASGTAYAGSRS